MIRIEFHRRDRSLLHTPYRVVDVASGTESRFVKALRTTQVSRVRFSTPPRCGSGRDLLLWRLSDRKSRQLLRLEELIFEDPDAPDRGFPKQRLRYGVRRHLRRLSFRDTRHTFSRIRRRMRSRRTHQRR